MLDPGVLPTPIVPFATPMAEFVYPRTLGEFDFGPKPVLGAYMSPSAAANQVWGATISGIAGTMGSLATTVDWDSKKNTNIHITMSTGFQRHSRGGRFKEQKRYTGNESLRAQQRQIIDALKFNRGRAEQYGEDAARGMDRVTSKELENQQLLQNLENKIFENKRRNIQIRSDREVSFIKSQSDEFGREKDFWMKVAPEFFGGVAKTAVAGTDYLEKQDALNKYNQLVEDGTLTQITDYDSMRSELGEKLYKELVDKRRKLLAEGTVDSNSVAAYTSKIIQDSGPGVQKLIVAGWVQPKAWDSMMESTLVEASKTINPVTGKPFDIDDPDTAYRILMARAFELEIRAGITDPKVRQKLRNKAQAYATSYKNEQTRSQTIFKQNKVFEENVNIAVKTRSAVDIREAIESRIGNLKPDATNDLDTFSESEATLLVFERMATSGQFATEDLLRKATYDMPSDFANWDKEVKKGDKPFQTLEQKFPGGWKKLAEKYRTYKKGVVTQYRNDLAFAQIQEIKSINEGLSKPSTDGGIDLTTKKGRDDLQKRLRVAKSKGQNDVVKHINGYLTRDPDADLNVSEHWTFKQAVGSNNLDLVANIYRKMSDGDKKIYGSDYELVQTLNQNGANAKEVKDKAKRYIQKVTKTQSIDQVQHPTAYDASQALEQAFYTSLNSIYKDPKWVDNPVGMIDKAWELATDDLNNNTGLFEYEDSASSGGERVKFKHWEPSLFEKQSILNPTQLASAVSTSPTTWKDLNIVSKQDLGDLAENLQTGRKSLRIPDNVHMLHKLGVQDSSGKVLSKREIINTLLEKNGFDQRLRPGPYEFSKASAAVLGYKVSPRISDNEAQTVTAKAELFAEYGWESVIPPWVNKSWNEGLGMSPEQWTNDESGGFFVNTTEDTLNLLKNKHKWGIEAMFTDDGRLRFYSPFGGV